MPEKVLAIGPVNGRLKELISKVSAIQSKHGPFAALFIIGDLFHPSDAAEISLQQQQADLLDGKLELPIPTYFYQGTSPLSEQLSTKLADAAKKNDGKQGPQGLVQLVNNLYYAKGKSGVFVTQEGLRVTFVGGAWDAKKFAEHNEAESAKEFDPEEWYESDLQRSQDEQVAHITPATVHRLLAHPAFRIPPASSSTLGTTSAGNGAAKPGTLAAARASASQDQARSNAQNVALQLLTSRPPIDLLLTNCWPTGITLFSTPSNPADPTGGLPDPTARMWGSPAIARLASHACPRYHFALAPSSSDSDLPVGITDETVQIGTFWERAPYITDLSTYLPNQAQQAATPQGRRQAERLKSVTRFVSLARFANEKKKRWFLALNLTPAEEQQKAGESVALPGNVTQTPYFVPIAKRAETGKRPAQPAAGEMDAGPNFRFQESSRKRQKGEGNEEVPPAGYVCRICNVEGHYIRACPVKQQQQQQQQDKDANPSSTGANTLPLSTTNEKGGWSKSTMPLPAGLPAKPSFASQHRHHQNGAAPARRQMIPVGPSNCWFCLSNPSVAKSLIVTIGAESYLVFPKGPFSHPTINTIPHDANHLLIVPLTHTSNLLPPSHPVLLQSSPHQQKKQDEVEEEEERARVRREMEETKSNVRQLWFERKHSMLEWTMVRVRTSSRMTHFQTQLVALLTQVVREKDLVKALGDALEAIAGSSSATKPLKICRNPDEISHYFNPSPTTTTSTTGSGSETGEADGYFHLALHLSEPEPSSSSPSSTTGGRKEWLIPLDTSSRFPVQFVRTTLAEALDLPHLADWKSAQSSNPPAANPSPSTEATGADGGGEIGESEEEKERKRSAGLRSLLLQQSA